MPLVAKAPKRGAGRGGQGLRAGPGSEWDHEATLAAASPLFIKTKLCKFFAAGVCSRGAGCRFAHGQGDLSELPDFRNTQFCPSVLLYGVCEAQNCTFAHSKGELRPRIDTPPATHHGEAAPRAPAPLRSGGLRAAEQRRAGQEAMCSVLRLADELLTARQGADEVAGLESPRDSQTTVRCWLSESPHESPQEATCSVLRLADELLMARQGPDEGKDLESPRDSETTVRCWASDARGWEFAEPTSDYGGEADSEAEGDPPCRVEVRNTFFTVVGGDEAYAPPRRTMSSPALTCHP